MKRKGPRTFALTSYEANELRKFEDSWRYEIDPFFPAYWSHWCRAGNAEPIISVANIVKALDKLDEKKQEHDACLKDLEFCDCRHLMNQCPFCLGIPVRRCVEEESYWDGLTSNEKYEWLMSHRAEHGVI